jgi:hypothetical protein
MRWAARMSSFSPRSDSAAVPKRRAEHEIGDRASNHVQTYPDERLDTESHERRVLDAPSGT